MRPLSELEKQLLKSKEESEAKLEQLQKEIEEVKLATLRSEKRKAPEPPVKDDDEQVTEDQTADVSTEQKAKVKDLKEVESEVCSYKKTESLI